MFISNNLFIVLFLINLHENFPVLFLPKELCLESLDKEYHGLVDWSVYLVSGKRNERRTIFERIIYFLARATTLPLMKSTSD